MAKFIFDDVAKKVGRQDESGNIFIEHCVWTDGVCLSTEDGKDWMPAFVLKLGKRYKVTVEQID
jgi:hypothetical protein